jgi:hypothetical protein
LAAALSQPTSNNKLLQLKKAPAFMHGLLCDIEAGILILSSFEPFKD